MADDRPQRLKKYLEVMIDLTEKVRSYPHRKDIGLTEKIRAYRHALDELVRLYPELKD